MLGPSGVRVLDFYIAHSAVINGLVVLYAALLLVARLNLRRIENLALKEVRQQLNAVRPGKTRSPITGVSWPEIVAQGSRFPLVVRSSGWYPRRATPATLEKLLPLQTLVDQVLAEREATVEAAGTGD